MPQLSRISNIVNDSRYRKPSNVGLTVSPALPSGCTSRLAVSSVILSLLLAILATSCSVNYHLRKATKKGYRCEEVADTITITSVDSIPYVLRDSIMWERVLVQKDTIVRYKRSFSWSIF